ncbi:MAG TPA: pantothenate kinase [Waterburya sp.]
MSPVNDRCLMLMIGNSRLHWAWFVGATLNAAWDTQHLSAPTVEQLIQRWTSGVIPEDILPPVLIAEESDKGRKLPLYIASVVPPQTELWQAYPTSQVITLDQVPLLELYPTLGIDRALAVFGAGERLGYPVLVIDAGTALTFTGVDVQKRLRGGAILPGLGLQLQSLAGRTAALPAVRLPTYLPQRWAMQTPIAIESGVIYTVLAGIRDFIEDWQSRFPDSHMAVTGGDSPLLLTYLREQFPETARQLIADPYLIFWGIRSVIAEVAS